MKKPKQTITIKISCTERQKNALWMALTSDAEAMLANDERDKSLAKALLNLAKAFK